MPRFDVFVVLIVSVLVVGFVVVLILVDVVVVGVILELVPLHHFEIGSCHDTGSVAGFGFSRLGGGYVVQK